MVPFIGLVTRTEDHNIELQRIAFEVLWSSLFYDILKLSINKQTVSPPVGVPNE